MEKDKIRERTAQSITAGEISYCAFFSLLLFAKAIGLYDGQGLFKVFLVTACVFWLIKMCLTDYSIRELGLAAGICGLTGVVYLCSGEKGAFLYALMIVGLKDVNIKRVFAWGCAAWTAGFVPMVILHVTHILDGLFKIHTRPLVGHVVRWALGYAHPNVAHVSYLVLVLFLVYLLDRRFSWKAFFLLMSGNIYVLLYTGSQTGFIAVSVYLLLNVYLMYRRDLGKVEQGLVQCIFPAAVLVSLIAPLVLENGTLAFQIVNKLTNTRLWLSQYFLQEQPSTLFGARLGELVTPFKTMDNSYVFAYLTYGTVLFVVICIGYLLLIRVCCREKKWKELALIASVVIAGITEPFLFNTSFKNISLLFMGGLLYGVPESGGKRIKLLSGYNREFLLPDYAGKMLFLGNTWKRRKKSILLAALILALAGGAAYGGTARMPQYISAPRAECDPADTEDFYLEESEASGNAEMWVLGYVDNETAMWRFGGNTVLAEYVRGIVSSALLSGCIGGIIILIVCGRRDRKRN